MIEINKLSKTFNKGHENRTEALKDINLNINAGEYLVMVGANGSGKSTLLNCVAGSVLPTSGVVKFSGDDVTKLQDFERSKWVARVFQNPLSGTAPELSILDNFRLAAIRTRSKTIRIGIDKAFENRVKERIAGLKLGLEDRIDRPMGTLSGGQRQALTLLMSVMDECKILLLDEPTAALDPRSAEKVMQIADDVIDKYKLTAILVTHNLKEAFTYGKRIVQLSEGEIVKDIGDKNKGSLKQADIFNWFS